MENTRYVQSDQNQLARTVNYDDVSLTENTRVCYPLENLHNIRIPAIADHPKNVIFLTCDAFGVLPPVSELTMEQAMYHFISGYTSKVAGTEVGIKEPVPTFSACFGEAFIPLHPFKYADLLDQMCRKHKSRVWLINTGWIRGPYGEGERMSLAFTRKIIDHIHNETLDMQHSQLMKRFGFKVPV